MMVNFIIGGFIFGYAFWALWKFINRAKRGKCASCEIKETCSSESCCEGTNK
ncbi:hydrolase [Robertmurraya siralis]|uniref:Hydrolase n=2 Tax=Robertmurraya siralis TaxID=77777 RepID=A0A920BUZ3_9BACI|nr:FeoB-associated Cys-rich membrane protein [Robertmurraya siralis]PAE18320.1 FeoB-associated Cys-rich membrane protein [Bacillus sp. 7504-2]GIN62812.1 hydrolase [Robertmurraya siralis]